MKRYVIAIDKLEIFNQRKGVVNGHSNCTKGSKICAERCHKLPGMARHVSRRGQGSASRVLPIGPGGRILLYARQTPSLFQVLRILHSITSIE